MNTSKMISALMLFVLVAGVAMAAQVPVDLTTAKLDGIELEEDVTNSLNIERGDAFDLKVVVQALPTVITDLNNIEMEAVISGYEYGSISDTIELFDMEPAVSYVKKFSLSLPENMVSDDYLLKIRVSGRNMEDTTFYYNLNVDAARHQLEISDFSINPATEVEAGYSVIGRIYVKNSGDKDEDNVRATLSIPELGLRDSQYLKEIESEDSDFFEDLMVFIPTCTPEGSYKVIAEVEYDEHTKVISEEKYITVKETGYCETEGETRTEITALEEQTLMQGSSVYYPLTIENTDVNAKTYTIEVSSLSWGTAVVEPSNLVIVKAGESKKVYVKVEADKDAPVEQAVFTTTVSAEGEENVLTFVADITESEGSDLRSVLEVLLIVLVVILIIIGLVIGFKKAKSSDDEEKTYY